MLGSASTWRHVAFGIVGVLVGIGAAAGQAGAQQSEVQGIVVSGTGTPLEDVAVTLEADGEQRYEGFTDRNGFYRIVGIAPGSYTLRIRRIGYSDREQEITLGAGERRTVTVRMEASAVALDEILVTPEQGAAVRELGRQVVTSIDLQTVPVPAGASDLATYLQILPGVTTTGDRGGQLYVRGGTPSENMVLVDGVPIYQPFHIVGFFSIFPEDLVSRADFYAGGFGARYSGRTSSVLDVRLRDGVSSGVRATASASPFIAEALIEGGGGPFEDGSWLVSARRSLIEETSSAILGSEQPLAFESQLVKVSSSSEGDARCSALALRTADRGRIDPEDPQSRVSWDNLAAGIRCAGIWPNGEMIEAHLGFSHSSADALTRGASQLRSSIWRINHDAHTVLSYGSIPVHLGLQAYIETFDYDLAELYSEKRDKNWIPGVSAYAEAVVPVGTDVEVRPGLVAVAAPAPGLEPRLRASWNPLGRSSEVVQGALGLYRQHVFGVSDMRDVGSVFAAWVEPADDPLKALHARLGWQQSFGDFRWSLEGYYNRMWEIPVPVWLAVARYTTELGQADGEAYGADLRLEYRTPRFYAFLGYGYGRIAYQAADRNFADWFDEPVQGYNPPHDRRHQLNAVTSVDLAGFDISARWQFGSGLPFTQPLGFDDVIRFSTRLYDVREWFGTTRLILDKPFNARMPTVHRLDASIQREFELPFGDLALQAGVVNAYDRRNMFYYDIFTGRRLDQLPFAPYAAVTVKSGND